MGCREFEDRLEAYLAGTLVPRERRVVEEHLAECLVCRELNSLARTSLDEPSADSPDLTQAVLARTSGSTCDRAEEQLCAWVDGTLEQIDGELVRLHAARCDACSALAGALTRMAEELPELAELDPGPGFASAVLSSTVSLDRRVFRHLDRLADAWRGLLERPRIAWEGAYLGTFLLALVFVAPGAPLADIPRKAAGLARINPVAELREPVAEVEARVATGAQSLWDSSGRRIVRSTRQATEATIEKIESELGTFWNRTASQGATDGEHAPETTNETRTGQGESK